MFIKVEKKHKKTKCRCQSKSAEDQCSIALCFFFDLQLTYSWTSDIFLSIDCRESVFFFNLVWLFLIIHFFKAYIFTDTKKDVFLGQ